MNLKVQQIFRSLEPYKVATDLGMSIQEDAGSLFVPHPKDKERRLMVSPAEFISATPDCDFLAGDVFDFLAVHFDGSYRLALQYVLDNYRDLAYQPPGISIQGLLGTWESDLTSRRNQFLKITNWRNNVLGSIPFSAEVRLWFNKQGLEMKDSRHMLYLVTGEELNQVLNMEFGESKDCFIPGDVHLVYPYFSDHHTVSLLRIDNLKQKDTRTVMLHSAKYAFLGLQTCLPKSEVRVYRAADECVTTYGHLTAQANYNVGCVHLHFNSNVQSADIKLEKGSFMISGKPDFSNLVRNRVAFDDFQIAEQQKGSLDFGLNYAKSWHDYVLLSFQEILDKDRTYSPAMSAFIEALKGDMPACKFLMGVLESNNRTDLLAQIKQHIDSHRIFPLGSMVISETPTGYLAKRSGTNAESYFSNFVIKIDSNLWFPESNEMFHYGRVVIDSQEFPIVLSAKNLSKPGDILQHATAAVRNQAKEGVAPNPVITDTTYRNRLAEVLNSQASLAPNYEGVKVLGWNPKKTAFITPTWQSKVTGTEPTSKLPYPAAKFLENHFSFQVFGASEQAVQVPAPIRSMIAVLVSSLTRAFLKLPTPAVRIMRHPCTLNAAHAIFRALGQTQVVELNPNRRGGAVIFDSEFLSGFPIMVATRNEDTIKEIPYPLFLVSETGLSYSGHIDKTLFSQIAVLTQTILNQVTVGLLRDSFKAHSIFTDLNPQVYDMVLEGKRVIELFAGQTFPVHESDMPKFYSVLAEILYRDLPKFFQFDLADQTVSFNTRKISNFKRRELHQELVSCGHSAEMRGEYFIVLRSEPTLRMLSTYYGKQVKLFHSTDSPASAGPDATAQLVTY